MIIYDNTDLLMIFEECILSLKLLIPLRIMINNGNFMFNKFYCFVPDDYFTKLSNPLRGMENHCQGGRVLASQEPGVKRKREESDVEDRG